MKRYGLPVFLGEFSRMSALRQRLSLELLGIWRVEMKSRSPKFWLGGLNDGRCVKEEDLRF